MRGVVHILRAIKGAIGWLNLPFDVQTLWKFTKQWVLPSLPTVAVVVLGYIQHAPFWQTALMAGGIFAVFYFGIYALSRLSAREGNAPDMQRPQRDNVREDSRPLRRGIVAEGRSKHQDEGSKFYDTLDIGIHTKDDAESIRKNTEFGVPHKQQGEKSEDKGTDNQRDE